MKVRDIPSEKKILSCILNAHLDYGNLFIEITEDVFSAKKTKLVFKVLKDYYEENSDVPSLSIVRRKIKGELRKEQKIDQLKSYNIFINKLVNMNMKRKTQSYLDFYISELLNCYKTKKHFDLIETINEMLSDGKDPNAVTNFISRKLIEGDAKDRSIKIVDYKDNLGNRIKELKNKKKRDRKKSNIIYTGIPLFDKETGGIEPGEILIFAGLGGAGKSIIKQSIAGYNICAGKKGIIFTNEMTNSQVENRIDSNLTGIKHRKFEKGTLTKLQIRKLKEIVKSEAKSGQLKIVEIYQGCTVLDIENTIRRNKWKPDFLIVDYAVRMSPSFSTSKTNYLDWTSVGGVIRELKNLALKLPVPLITSVQLKPEAENKERVGYSDIALSKLIIESESDILCAIIYTPKMKLMGKGYLQLLKVRQGFETEMIPFKPKYNYIDIEEIKE